MAKKPKPAAATAAEPDGLTADRDFTLGGHPLKKGDPIPAHLVGDERHAARLTKHGFATKGT